MIYRDDAFPNLDCAVACTDAGTLVRRHRWQQSTPSFSIRPPPLEGPNGKNYCILGEPHSATLLTTDPVLLRQILSDGRKTQPPRFPILRRRIILCPPVCSDLVRKSFGARR